MQNSAIIGLPPVSTLMNQAERAGQLLKSASRKTEAATAQTFAAGLEEAAGEFESLFVAYLLKVMRETIEESGLAEGGLGRGIYTELFDQEVARLVAKQSPLGISDIILRNVSQASAAAPRRGNEDSGEPSDGTRPHTSSAPPAASLDEAGDIAASLLPAPARVSSAFGFREDPLDGKWRFHRGLDLAAPEGAPVRAPLGGRVVFAGHERGYGNTVVIEHSRELRTRYAHLGSMSVRTGDAVADEQDIGSVGTTGRSTGAHLHFEVLRSGEAVTPTPAALE